MSTKTYAGIGARKKTPSFILELMGVVSSKLESMDYTLRSGGAKGCDLAFESGVRDDSRKEIYRPHHSTVATMNIASNFHPNWDECKESYKELHGRNVLILLGKDLESPVDFVICYTADGKDSGGTGLGIRIAEHYNIPVFNLYHTEARERLEKFVGINKIIEEVDIF